jgi:urea transporter
MRSLENINLCNIPQIFKWRDASMQLSFTVSLNVAAYHISLTAVVLGSTVKEMLFVMPAGTD